MKTAPSISINKITRPRLPQIAQRERLFRLLDKGHDRPVVWVGAPAGSGKTTLVASWIDTRKLPCLWYQVDQRDGDIASFFYYLGLAAKKAAPRHKHPLPLLTPEYLQGIPMFTRRYFEELFRRLKSPATIVLDNYQELPHDAGFSDMIGHALDTVPEGSRFIILSRNDPPAHLAKLRANNRLQLMGWEDVRFTRKESAELLKAQGWERPDRKTADLLHETSEGWAAGLVLMTEAAKTKEIPYPLASERSREAIFNYFASEIFDKTDSEKRVFLLKTSFFPWMTTDAAEQLTGDASARSILSGLNRNHYFTDRRPLSQPVFQYHPLFKEFLQARAKSVFSQEELTGIQRSTASILEQEGRIDEAVTLYIDAKDHRALAGMISAHAHTFVQQGRQNLLDEWLSCLPSETVANDPWLLYWSGICRMIHDPRTSRNQLEQAYLRFKAEGNRAGVFHAWASIIDTFVFEWGVFGPVDRWIAVLDELLHDTIEFPSHEIEMRVAGSMLSALTFRQHRRDDLEKWAERLERGILASRDVQLRMAFGHKLVVYYLWIGDFSRIAFIIDELRPAGGVKGCDPLTRQYWYVMNAMYSLWAADGKTCSQAVADGLKNAEDNGIHQFDMYLLQHGVIGGLVFGDPTAAESYFERMTQAKGMRLLDNALYHYLASSIAASHGKFAVALDHAKISARITDTTECHISQTLILFNLAYACFKLGLLDESDRAYQRGMEIGAGMISMDFLGSLFGAEIALHRGNEHEGLVLLKKGMALGARYGMLICPLVNDTSMSRLCAKALTHGIETEYVQRLIRERKLTPPEGIAVEQWPYPIAINTLGTFRLMKDGKPVTFSGKVQKKPLEMLKVLIAFGGTDVPEERICEALWPATDGDTAHRSFETTLYRLRKLVGDKTLILREGLLSLDRSSCWVDSWEFEWLLNETVNNLSENDSSGEKAVRLYKGHFLPADTGQAWAVSMRERLRNRFGRLIVERGTALEAQRNWDQGLAYFQKGLEIDDLTEEFYQHAMLCHIRLGRTAEAASLYQRCKTAMQRAFGLSPSSRTESLYTALRNG